jgi:hypothetical protein
MEFDSGQRCRPLPLERPRRRAERTSAAGDNERTTAESAAVSVRACWPAMQEGLRAERRALDFLRRCEDESPEPERNTDELRRRLRRLDALVWAVGLLLLAVAAGATCVYWEYARPFVATDDPVVPTRHFLVVVRAAG